MDGDGGYQAEELRFFGHVVASAAHEWGNVLAVINESAGLLEDLACLAGRGAPLDPDRLAQLAAAVTRQVRRGDALLSQLRRFAHCVDVPCRVVNLVEAIATLAYLAGRSVARHGVCLEARPGEAVSVSTDPFRLCHLLFLGVEYAAATAPGGRLVIEALPPPLGPAVAVPGLPAQAPPLPDAVLAAAQAVNATVRLEPEGRLLVAWE